MALAPLESHHAPVDQLPVDPADAVIGKRWNGSDVPRWGPRLTFFTTKISLQTVRTNTGGHIELCT